MRKGKCKVIHYCWLVLSSVLLTSCDSQQLPPNAQLSLSPASRSVEVVTGSGTNTCWRDDYPYLDVPMMVSLTDAQLSPIGGIAIQVYADWTAHTTPFVDVVSLLYDFNGDGAVDAETETVSGDESGVFEWKTAQYSGSVAFIARFNLTCPYSGEIVVAAGGFHAVSTFNVVHEQAEPEPASDPTLSSSTTIQNEPSGKLKIARAMRL